MLLIEEEESLKLVLCQMATVCQLLDETKCTIINATFCTKLINLKSLQDIKNPHTIVNFKKYKKSQKGMLMTYIGTYKLVSS